MALLVSDCIALKDSMINEFAAVFGMKMSLKAEVLREYSPQRCFVNRKPA
jgi:hypothetical protein